MDAFGRYAAILLAAILILLFPLQYIAQSQQETMENSVCCYAEEFTDLVRQQGLISRDAYEDFLRKLNATGELYDITVEAAHPRSGKEMTQETIGAAGQEPELKVMPYIYPSELSDEAFSGEGEIQPLSAHIHTADCYAGHRHDTGCIPTGDTGRQVIVTKSWSNNSSDGTQDFDINVYCNVCKNQIFRLYGRINTSGRTSVSGWIACIYYGYDAAGVRTRYFYEYYCYSGGPFSSFTISNIYQAISDYCESLPKVSSSDYGSSRYMTSQPVVWTYSPITYINGTDMQMHSVPYPGCTYCGRYGTSFSCGKQQDETPICNRVVTSITALKPAQTVDKGGAIDMAATAVYLDGHLGTVNCTSNFDPFKIGTQSVTLTYSGLVGNAKTTGIRMCTVNVTVQENNIPAYITITPSSSAVYNGAEPTYTVTVVYTVGLSKTVGTGFTVSGWSTGPGYKNVTITYSENGVTVTGNITILVKPNLTGLSVSPTVQNIRRYTQPSIIVRAIYEDGTDANVSGYLISGLNTGLLGRQNIRISYTENKITRSADLTVNIDRMIKTCSVCGTVYELDDHDQDNGCPVCKSAITGILVTPENVSVSRGDPLPIMVEAVYRNEGRAVISGWTSNYNADLPGYQEVIVTYEGWEALIKVDVRDNNKTCPLCGIGYILNEDGSDPGCPSCKKAIVSIDAIPKIITIKKHKPFPITVTATFRDGHTEEVTDWAADLVTDTAGTFDVTIYYKTAQDHINVTVLDDDRILCPYCSLSYSFSQNPEGCPDCYYTLSKIKASLRNGGTSVLYNSRLDIELTLIFRDTHMQVIYSGWTIEDYHPDVAGMQTVTVSYKGLHTTLSVEVIDAPNKKICPKGHEYYINEDGTDPGCPYCLMESQKEGAVLYFDITYTPEIMEIVDKEGIYRLGQGDYLTITVMPRKVSFRSKLSKLLLGSGRAAGKTYTFGGEIK